jgi:ATP-dependent Clp protease adaptor protein ClpS
MGEKHTTREERDVLFADEIGGGHNLVLYNDEVNTFDFVIESLIEICRHDRLQAEQCTYLVHYRGRCAVKAGTFQNLRPLCDALLDRGLTAAIE